MHPNEDHSDLRPHGQTMLDLSSWTIPRNNRDKSSLDNESESEVEEEGNASREKNPRRPSERGAVNRVVPNDFELHSVMNIRIECQTVRKFMTTKKVTITCCPC